MGLVLVDESFFRLLVVKYCRILTFLYVSNRLDGRVNKREIRISRARKGMIVIYLFAPPCPSEQPTEGEGQVSTG